MSTGAGGEGRPAAPARRAASPILRALGRARLPILSLFLTYALAVAVGVAMAQAGNALAVTQRDTLVANARASDPASLALQRGDRLSAALVDFSRNLLLGGASSTLGGLAVVLPYAFALYRGWVGGIVSIDGAHRSRLARPDEATYYLVTLLLQLVPYSLAGGAGVNLGLAYLRPRPHYAGARWLGLPIEALRDVAWIYVLVVPLFFVASLWEFLLA